MKKECKYIFLPTEESSIYLHNETMYDNTTTMHIPDGKQIPQHIYVLSDEEIKNGDWCFNFGLNKIEKAPYGINPQKEFTSEARFMRKIIATTNPELLFNVETHAKAGEKYTCVDGISQSDIEYIISLYNSKNKSVDVEKLAEKEFSSDEYTPDSDRRIERNIWKRGYNQCLQDSADNLFLFYKWLKEIGRLYSDATLEEVMKNDITEFQSRTKEQPKSDTVMVEYELIPQNHASGLELTGNPIMDKSILQNYQPKIKDGCIVIVK